MSTWAVSPIPLGPRKVPSSLSLSFPKHKARSRLPHRLPVLTAGCPAGCCQCPVSRWLPGPPGGPSAHWLAGPRGVDTFSPVYRGASEPRDSAGRVLRDSPSANRLFREALQGGSSGRFGGSLGMRVPVLLVGEPQIQRSSLTCPKPLSRR